MSKQKKNNFEKTKDKPENLPLNNGPLWDIENEPSLLERRCFALAKLNIDHEALQKAPPLTSILEQAEGGIPAVIHAIRFSDDPQVAKFLKVYDRATNQDRTILPIEAFAIFAEVDFASFLGECILALQNQFANIVKVIAITNHPKTMRARVEYALTPGGVKDRNAIDTALRFLPQNKGAVNVFNFGPGGRGPEALSPEDREAEDVFPELNETQKLLTEG